MERNPLSIIDASYLEEYLNRDDKVPKSKIRKYIPDWALYDLCVIATDYTIDDCNEAATMISEIMVNKLGFSEIGSGTNRIAYMRDGYVFKVALDDRGIIDNSSEYKRSIEFPQYFAKTYEVGTVSLPKRNGTYKNYDVVLVCEYCELITESTFENRKREITSILRELSEYYVMEDIGLTTKNFCNWGIRYNNDEENLVIIDYAYTYPIKNKFEMLRCGCGAIIRPNALFTGYTCTNSACGMNYSVPELLNKARYNYDADDDEVIEIVDENGNKTGKMVALSGEDNATIREISADEAAEINSKFVDVVSSTLADSIDAEKIMRQEPLSVKASDYFNNGESEPKYQALDIKNIIGGN